MASLHDFLRAHPAPAAEGETTPTEPPLDKVTAQLEAQRYRELCAVMGEVLAADDVTPADALRRLITAMYGEHSPEAAKVSQPAPVTPRGGAELAIATIRGQQATIKAQQRKLNALQKALTEELQKLDNEAIAIARDVARTPEKGLADVMEVAMSPDVPTPATLTALYTRHQSNTCAMGLLLGVIVSTLQRTGVTDLYDTHSLIQLHAQVLRELTATV